MSTTITKNNRTFKIEQRGEEFRLMRLEEKPFPHWDVWGFFKTYEEAFKRIGATPPVERQMKTGKVVLKEEEGQNEPES